MMLLMIRSFTIESKPYACALLGSRASVFSMKQGEEDPSHQLPLPLALA